MITERPDHSRTDDLIHGPFYLDAHIHIYPCFDEAAMLDAAAAHVASYDNGEGVGVLALTELSQYDVFRRWRDTGTVGRWRMESRGEPAVLFGWRNDGRRLIVLAGRQIVTHGRLGVLALGADADYRDGRDIEHSLADARAAGATPVVSYGVGKWHGWRGRTIDALIEAAEPGELAVGEIGARPLVGPTPRQFVRAAQRGLTILPGSDPLILRGSQGVVCSYCVRVDGGFRADTFGRDFLDRARRLGPDAPRYGGHLSFAHAVYHQVAMRCARRMLSIRGQAA